MKKVFLSLIAALMSGCISIPVAKSNVELGPVIATSDDVYNNTTSEYDTYIKLYTVISPMLNYGSSDYSVRGYYYLKAAIKDGKLFSIGIVVLDYGDTWRFYNNAFDSNGEKLQFVEASRTVIDGATEEKFVILLTEEYLTKNIDTSLNLKIYGETRNQEIRLNGYFIKGFLNKVKTLTK